MESIDILELVERLGSEEDAVRKMAVFKLQSNIGDPSFADVFISEGGLTKLRYMTLNATGNTLAYSLTSFSRLLEVDLGWEYINQPLVERVVELVVIHPLVNILRGAMSILVSIVSHSQITGRTSPSSSFGFQALKPAIAVYPQFLEMLVSRLSSADHALCANALQLINSLMRDAITNDSEVEWPRFIKRLQDLGVIKNVYVLMQSTALQDLAQPLLEFQSLTKVLLRKWREVAVDVEKQEHRRALKALHIASNPEPPEQSEEDEVKRSRKHNPEKWRRLGFETESPAWEFKDVGFLEQASRPVEQRCPVARASLAVTSVLYDHFDVDKSDAEDRKSYLALDSRTNLDKIFHPLLLQWSRLHTAGLQALFRLWRATGAELDDFTKVLELVRILVEQVVGQAPRTKNIQEVEEELAEFDYSRLRELQMELLELTYEDAWGHHLRQVRDELNHEALQFVKEQRIRCLLLGAWFPYLLEYRAEGGPVTKQDLKRSVPSMWRYVRLSHNRRYLHYGDFDTQGDVEPGLDALMEKIDLSVVSSVVSNVSASESPNSSTSTLKTLPTRASTTKITIHGYLEPSKDKESILLTLNPPTHSLASEWLDGLLMLLNQQPITAETNKMIHLIGNYSLKIRLLNVKFDDVGVGDEPEIPSREGLDEEYYYDVFGGL
ncbi:MAG: hypothetical protein M1827_007018 [Pycnora praestabilis]|nr:MAG: hypothetical protein M1827_007018 [Pycnora praestabilis]